MSNAATVSTTGMCHGAAPALDCPCDPGPLVLALRIDGDAEATRIDQVLVGQAVGNGKTEFHVGHREHPDATLGGIEADAEHFVYDFDCIGHVLKVRESRGNAAAADCQTAVYSLAGSLAQGLFSASHDLQISVGGGFDGIGMVRIIIRYRSLRKSRTSFVPGIKFVFLRRLIKVIFTNTLDFIFFPVLQLIKCSSEAFYA